MRVLGLVPARGGSKGVPHKNIRALAGMPLLAYTAHAALAATTLSRVVLSTDDPEIAETGLHHGLDVPFIRPATLARDETPMAPVVEHALASLEAAGDRFDAVCLLQPTSPLRRVEDIDACVRLLERDNADTVISVLPVPAEYNPHWVFLEAGDGVLRIATGEATPIPRRQELPPAYHRDGSVYVVRTGVLTERGSLFGSRVVGYVVDPARSVNVDTPEDWARAEQLVLQYGSALGPERDVAVGAHGTGGS
jgi:CMP-N-acetylneuraminic acid synthetase